MSSRGILFFDCMLLCLLLWLGVGNSVDLMAVDCSNYTLDNPTLYNPNSTSGRIYGSNVNLLLSTLTSNASRPNGFYNFTVGSGDPSNDAAVYGLFLCRGDDLGINGCQNCVGIARNEVLRRCPNAKSAGIWYDQCMLRYSDQSIFSRMDATVMSFLYTGNIITNTASFNRVLGDTMDQIVIKAANDNISGKKFAVEDANFSAFDSLYALVECTPDLPSGACETCLKYAISNLHKCCGNRPGGRVLRAAVILGTRA